MHDGGFKFRKFASSAASPFRRDFRVAAAVGLGLGLHIHHLPLGRENLSRSWDQLRQPYQRQHVHRDERNAVVLALFRHGFRPAQRLASARLAVFLQGALKLGHGPQELRVRLPDPRRVQPHADADVEDAGPDGVDFRDFGEDGVEVVDCLGGFDLDHDGGLLVHVFVDGFAGVAGEGGDAGDQAERRGGAGAVVFGAVFGGGDGVSRFGDGVDLWDDDRGAGIEGEADGRVVMTRSTGFLRQKGLAGERGGRTYRTQGVVRPSLMNCIS